MLPIDFGVKRSKISAMDIKVEIWFQGSRMTHITHMSNPWDVRCPKFYQVLSLSTQERSTLYLLTPFESLGYVGDISVSLAHTLTVFLSFILLQ
jgi:hypothetical protein